LPSGRFVDDVDRKLLELLREDAHATNAAIGEKVGLTEAAVRRRIARMRAAGTIVRFTIVTVPLGPEGLVLIRCRPGSTSEVLRFVRERAIEVFETSGEYDVGAFVECSTMDELNRQLDEIRSREGVVSTITLIRLARAVRIPPPPPPPVRRAAPDPPASPGTLRRRGRRGGAGGR
jgi:Lrp/AsnC family transcriptional regulator of lysine biosynthesis